MPEQFPKKLTGNTEISFSVDRSGLYSVSIIARCKGKEDLRIEIDDLKLRELPAKDKPQYNNIPPSWNGTKLKGLAKTIIFILKLSNGEHILKFIPTIGAIIDEYRVEKISDPQNLQFNLKIQAEDGDRRPWVTFALINLSLNKFTTELNLKRRFIDSDDVKIIIDGNIKRNDRSLLHKYWYFIGSLFTGETKTETFIENLPSGIHYIEIWADRMPKVNKVTLDLGETQSKRTPTVDDPVWTGDFNDDTEEILMARLILGEAENQPKEAKIAVGYTVMNRIKKHKANWGYSVREVILMPSQYDGMWNANTYQKVRDPFSDTSQNRLEQWQESYEVAVGILSDNLSDTASGSTNFHSYTDPQDFPSWATEETFKREIGDLYFYELER